jgi:chromosome segregation ATPase
MADKPKTYAQQVQELKDQKDELLTDIEDLKRQISFIPELQDEISDLNARLAAQADKSRSSFVTDKAKTTDLIQRAESAEKGIRNLQKLNQDLIREKDSLQQQLDILGKERDTYRGLEDKVNLISKELKAANMRVAALNQQLRDRQVEFNEAAARTEKEILYLRELAKAQAARIQDVTATVQAMPDTISSLKDMISRW